MSTPTFRTGANAAQEAAKTGGGAAFAKNVFFSIKNGERAILRFLTDFSDILTVAQHSMVPTRPAPADFKGNWPQSNTAVCRRDPGFGKMYADCYVCDHVLVKGKPVKAQSRQWAIAVLREEVTEDGRVVGYRDAVRRVAEIKDGQATGAEVEEKAIVIVNMAYKNFFGSLDGYFGIYGTLLDRDYLIKRQGDGIDTDYQIIPLDPITMADGRRFDLRDNELMARYQPLPDLVGIVSQRASDDYFARFFDTRVPQPSGGSKAQSDSTPSAPPVSNDVDMDMLAAISQRVKGYTDSSSGGTRAYD